LILLILAAIVSFAWPSSVYGAMSAAFLFLVTLAILIYLNFRKPSDTWYNSRAIAESVKTRSWRWMMRAEPYHENQNSEIVSKQFISDLKAILHQNLSLSNQFKAEIGIKDPITDKMKKIRALPINDRLEVYKEERINKPANWYSQKSNYNKRSASFWFWISVMLHSTAIFMLLYRISNPSSNLPIEVLATAAGAVLTWLQAKKHNELRSSYALTAHEIVLIKGEALGITNEIQFSEFVIDSESAFSREHTQWAARKLE
jgi:Mg2+/citrate symporter